MAWYLVSFSLLGIAAWLPGFAVLRLAGSAFEPLGGLRTLARFCLGIGFWTGASFALAVLGALRPAGLRVTLGLVIGAAIVAALRGGARSERRRPDLSPQALVIGGATLLVLATCFLAALWPLPAWDADVYHLRLPKLYLAHHGFRPVPFNVYASWPLGVELLFGIAMLAADHVLATLVHFGLGLLTLYAAYVGGREHASGAAGRLAVLLLLLCPVLASELTIAYVDLGCTFFFVAGFLFVRRAVEGPTEGRKTALLLAGLCGGLLAGAKLSGIASAALLGVTYLAGAPRGSREELRASVRNLLGRFALPTLLLWLPWLAKSAWFTGNPFYPFLYGWFGGPDWSPALGEQLRTWHRSIGMGRGPLDYLLLPLRVLVLGGEGYARFDGAVGGFWLGVVPLTLVLGLREKLVRACVGLAALFFALWALSSQQARLLLPMLPLLAIAGAITWDVTLRGIPAGLQRALRVLVVAAALVGLGLAYRPTLGKALGVLQLHREHPAAPADALLDPAYGFLRREVPLEARVLCLNTNLGFFIEQEILADSFFEASQIADWLRPARSEDEVLRLLGERGVTHVLVEAEDWGIAYPRALLDLLDDPRRARALFHDDRFVVFELRPGEG